jgi:hypothetical protein
MSTLLAKSLFEAVGAKTTGFVSILQHCDELQDIYRPIAVYHKDEYATIVAVDTALKDFFGEAYTDEAHHDWTIVATIEL